MDMTLPVFIFHLDAIVHLCPICKYRFDAFLVMQYHTLKSTVCFNPNFTTKLLLFTRHSFYSKLSHFKAQFTRLKVSRMRTSTTNTVMLPITLNFSSNLWINSRISSQDPVLHRFNRRKVLLQVCLLTFHQCFNLANRICDIYLDFISLFYDVR